MKTFKSEEYKDVEVIVRTFGFYFEFLFTFKGKIYSSFHRVNPDFYHRVLYFLRMTNCPYSDEQMEASRKTLVGIAGQVIDELYFNK